MRDRRTHLDRRTFLRVTSSIGLLSTAGCLSRASSDTNDPDTSTTSNDQQGPQLNEPAAHADIAMKSDGGHHFAPSLVWIKPGGTVTWTNESGAHTTTAYHPTVDKPRRIPDDASPWDSGMFSKPGQQFEHTFAVEGVYDYFCIPHEYRAMVGSVIVGEPEANDEPALAPPQDGLPEEARSLLSELNTRTKEVLGRTNE